MSGAGGDAGTGGQPTAGGGGGGAGGSASGAGGMGGAGGTAGSGLGGAGRESGGTGGRAPVGGAFPGCFDPPANIPCNPAICERCANTDLPCACDGEGWCTCTPESCPKSQVCNPLARKCVDRCDTSDPDACQRPGHQGICTPLFGSPLGPTAGYCVDCARTGGCERDLFCHRDQCVECRQNCDCWYRADARETICIEGKCMCFEDRDCLGENSQGEKFVCVQRQCVSP